MTSTSMDPIKVKSTSRASAECSDVVLRETSATRLIFRPQIVENLGNPSAAVDGVFLFQKKGFKDAWADTQTIPLSSLKKGEGYRLDVKSVELLRLFENLRALYDLHAKVGVPRGTQQWVPVSGQLAKLASLKQTQIAQILTAHNAVGSELFAKLLKWATETSDARALVDRLVGLGDDGLRKLNIAVGLRSLRVALQLWKENARNPNEEFWQQSLTQHSFVLEYVFSWPITIVKDKAYVGGKSVLNEGGKIVDFLIQNRITQNAALIEIKTPASELLGKAYRGTYLPSEHLSGAVQQVLDYRHSLLREHTVLARNGGLSYEVFAPKCIVLIGSAGHELKSVEKRKAFELYRATLAGVEVITFDELFERTEGMLCLLEGPEGTEAEDDDIPF